MLRAYAAHRKGRSALRSEGALQEEAAGELSLGSLAPSDDGDEGGLEANHEDDDDSLGSLAPSDEEDANEPSGIPAATSMQAAFDGLCLGGLREQWTHEQHTHTTHAPSAGGCLFKYILHFGARRVLFCACALLLSVLCL